MALRTYDYYCQPLSLLSKTTNTYHRVLTHQHDATDFALASQTFPDLVHLLGADIVDGDDKDGFVLLE